MNNKIKTKSLGQLKNENKGVSKQDYLLDNMRKKQLLAISEFKHTGKYQFEDSDELQVKNKEIDSAVLYDNKDQKAIVNPENNLSNKDKTINNSNANIIEIEKGTSKTENNLDKVIVKNSSETKITKIPIEAYPKEESNLIEICGYDSSMKPRKGDITPKSHISPQDRKETDEKSDIQKETKKTEVQKSYEQEYKKMNTNDPNKSNQEFNNGDQQILFSEKIIESPIAEHYVYNPDEHNLQSNVNNISIESHSEHFLKKLQERLEIKGKDVPRNASQQNSNNNSQFKSVLQSNNITKDGIKRTLSMKKDEEIQSTKGISTKGKERDSRFIEENQNIDEVNHINFKLLEDSPTIEVPKKLKKNSDQNQVAHNDFEKFDLQQIAYKVMKKYDHTKLYKEESFQKRMMFDIFKRQTKEERLISLLEKNKVKLSEFARVNAFNRLIEDANRRLEATEKLETLKNNLDQNVVLKTFNDKEWSNVYNDRFIKYKNNKDQSLEKKIIEKEKKMKEEEDVIVQEIHNRTKKAPKKFVEKIVNRMYKEASKRELVKEQKNNELALIMKKQEFRSSPNYSKNKIDFTEFMKPTSVSISKAATNKIKAPQKSTKLRNNSNGRFSKMTKYTFDIERYITETDIERKTIPIPTQNQTKMNNTKIENYNKNFHKININNELKAQIESNFANTTKNNYSLKVKYLPDFIANDLVTHILQRNKI